MQRLSSLLAAVFVGVCLGGEPEPSYEGKTLGEWSAQAKDQDARLREQAARTLGRMGAGAKAAQTQLLHDEVTAQIRQDRSVNDAVRQQALAWAAHFQEDGNRLNEASLAIVQQADAEAAEYRQALHWAEAAVRLRPDTVEYLNTLGMARYRLGQFQEALSTLTRVRDLIQARDRAERKCLPAPPSTDQAEQSMPLGTALGVLLENAAFLAMTQHQLGQHEHARKHLQELRKNLKALQSRGLFEEEESRTYLQEAETLIEQDPRKPDLKTGEE
jgi:tetratricopeptide (TPR) repeat protein